MLWWRYQPQTQASRKTKRRQEAYEARRPGGHPAGSLPRRPQSLRGGRRLARHVNPVEAAVFPGLLFHVGIAFWGAPLFLRPQNCGLPSILRQSLSTLLALPFL